MRRGIASRNGFPGVNGWRLRAKIAGPSLEFNS